MRFTPRAEFPRQRPLLASPLVLLSGEELIITEFPRQRPLLASPLVLLSGEQLGCCGRGRYLLPTPGVIFDACGWAWTFSSTPRATRSAVFRCLSAAWGRTSCAHRGNRIGGHKNRSFLYGTCTTPGYFRMREHEQPKASCL